MKVIVFGSRGWDRPLDVKARLELLPPGSIVVHGASAGGGVDSFADRYARLLGFEVIPVRVGEVDRERARRMGRPRYAPLARNERMADEHRDADLAIGFWDGRSPGSKHMLATCRKLGIPVELHTPTAIHVRPDELQRIWLDDLG